jgi:GNAT superfamily N-acetyltransferase
VRPDDLRVRLADPAEIDAVMELAAACIAAMCAAGIDQWDEIYPNRETFSADIDARTLYLASIEPHADLAGVVVINDVQNPEYADVPWTISGSGIAVVHRLMIAPAHQGCGVARAVMAFAESRSRELGFDVMRLDAFTQNPRALRLYRGLGYRDAGAVRFRKGIFRCFEKAL